MEEVEKLAVVVEEEQEGVENLLDLLYTGTARHTEGLHRLKATMQVGSQTGFVSRKLIFDLDWGK